MSASSMRFVIVLGLLATLCSATAAIAQSIVTSKHYLPVIAKSEPPTSLPTATPLQTNTPVPTATNLPIPSATATNTPSATRTPTATPTATQMNTPLPTATNTSTSFPTFATPGPHFSLAYGPYRSGQAPGGATPSPAEIAADLDILQQETNLIRTYGSCNELAVIPSLAGQRLIYLYQGIWLSQSSTANQQELTCYGQLVHENGNLIGGIVGNEVLLRGDLTEAQLADLVIQAQQAGDVPVSTGETWAKWCALREQKPRCPGLTVLPPQVDFILAHVHPYWEAVPIEHAAAHVIAIQIFLHTTYTNKEVIIGEAGWPTCGTPENGAQPSVANQRQFIEELWQWANLYDIRVVYFEAFDEPWKQEPNGVGPCWGLYNADRTPKHTNLDWPTPTPAATPTTPTVRIDHPAGNSTTTVKSDCGVPIFGRVSNAQPGWQVQVEVFTNAWYIQDKWFLHGRAPVVDGQWSMPEVILAGQGQFNNHRIRATLLDEGGNSITGAEVTSIVRANSCTP